MARILLISAVLLVTLVSTGLGCSSQSGQAWDLTSKQTSRIAPAGRTHVLNTQSRRPSPPSFPLELSRADAFALLDTNRDGMIDREEWAQMFASMITNYDSNGDNVISMEEIQASDPPSLGDADVVPTSSGEPETVPLSRVDVIFPRPPLPVRRDYLPRDLARPKLMRIPEPVEPTTAPKPRRQRPVAPRREHRERTRERPVAPQREHRERTPERPVAPQREHRERTRERQSPLQLNSPIP